MFTLGQFLKSALESYGIDTVMTRTSVTQDQTLEERGNKAKGCDMFISLHTNAVGYSATHNDACVVMGIRSIKYPESKTLGDKLCEVTAQLLKEAEPNTKSDGVITKKSDGYPNSDWYGVIRHSCKHVKYTYLIEHGFHTNTNQCNWLYNDSNLKRLADAEAKVIADYFNIKGGGGGSSGGNGSTGGGSSGGGTNTPVSTEPKTVTMYISADSVRIRTSPQVSSDNFTGESCARGESVVILETDFDKSGNTWGRIDRGWICLKYRGESYTTAESTLSYQGASGESTTVASGSIYKVTLSSGSLRERSSTSYASSSNITGSHANGSEIRVVSLETVGSDVWAKLDNGNYVCKSKGGEEYLSYAGAGSAQSDSEDGFESEDDIAVDEATQIYQQKIDAFNAAYDKMAQDTLNDNTGHATSEATGFSNYYMKLYNQQVDNIKNDYGSSSLRMFGVPHQFTAEVDPRISATSELGRNFAESLIAEAPVVYIMPGKTDFLAGTNSKTKESWLSILGDAFKGDTENIGSRVMALLQSEDQDIVRYFGFKADYIEYMYKVNMLCRICAYYMGLWDLPVPWHTDYNIKFGYYDWRYFDFSSVYNSAVKSAYKDKNIWQNLLGLAAFELETMTSNYDQGDDRWIQFYVDSSSTSYSG